MTETFYDVLGVERDASQGEITEAYRRKVKQYHPDVSEEDDAAEAFKRVVQAEEVLGDEQERARYDRLGHDAYVGRVEDANAAGSERSPWTTEDRREQSHEVGFGDVGAASTSTSASTSASTSTGGGTTTARTSRAGPSTAGGEGSADASAGVGRAASRQSSAGWSDDTDSHNRWSSAAYGGAGTGEEADSTYAVHEWADREPAPPNTVTLEFTQQFAILSVALFVLYPMLVYVALAPGVPPVLNLLGALFTFGVVGYSLTVPKLSLVSFGAWSVLAPLLVLAVTDWGLWVEALAVLVCWVPFGYALVVAYVTRPA